VLTHTFDDRFKAARDAAGWHLSLDSLRASLADKHAVGGQQSPEGIPPGWRELNGEYEQRFGIPADQAHPTTGRLNTRAPVALDPLALSRSAS
jgi:hypothetical protein